VDLRPTNGPARRARSRRRRSIRMIDANGELIRELTLDPSRRYQPLTHA